MLRIMLGCAAATLGGAFAGPAGAYAGWKLGGLAATGNPIYLVPLGGTVNDGLTVLSDVADAADLDPGESSASTKRSGRWWG